MSIVSPFHDMCVAGCLANAALAVAAKTQAPEPREAEPCAPSPLCADFEAPQAAPNRTGWRRLAGALFSLVSGPTMPHRA